MSSDGDVHHLPSLDRRSRSLAGLPGPGAPPTPITQTVTTPPDRFVQITIEYDSGIR
jgi:hypothetical protein